MTNRIAIALGVALILALAADQALNGGLVSLFLARKFIGLVDWIAFWR